MTEEEKILQLQANLIEATDEWQDGEFHLCSGGAEGLAVNLYK